MLGYQVLSKLCAPKLELQRELKVRNWLSVFFLKHSVWHIVGPQFLLTSTIYLIEMITETEHPMSSGNWRGVGGRRESIMLCNDFRVMKARLFLQFENMARE